VLLVNNQKKSIIIDNLRARGYLEVGETEEHGFEYLLSMPIWSLTIERMEKLIRDRDLKKEELRLLQQKTAKDLWRFDLKEFEGKWETVQAGLEAKSSARNVKKGAKGVRGMSTSVKRKSVVVDEEDFKVNGKHEF
jgi:DNA topoisomerase-2